MKHQYRLGIIASFRIKSITLTKKSPHKKHKYHHEIRTHSLLTHSLTPILIDSWLAQSHLLSCTLIGQFLTQVTWVGFGRLGMALGDSGWLGLTRVVPVFSNTEFLYTAD